MKPPEFDVAVIGGGVVGAATARALAMRRRSVVVLERGDLSRPIGSSRGDARIWHFAGYPSEEYLDHGIRALERWRELEQETGHTLLLDTDGGVSYGDGIEKQAELLEDAGRECQLLVGNELHGRWPALTLPLDQPVLYQRDAGVIVARDALAALLASARRAGAILTEHTRVRTLTLDGHGVTLATDAATIRAGCVVVAAGPWSRQLLSTAAVDLDVRVTEQTVAWFDWKETPPPTLIEFGKPDPFALLDPHVGLKAGLHEPGESIDDPEAPCGPGRENDVQRLTEWVAKRFQLATARPVRVETCRYTWTPDESFSLERHGAVVVASACSGQGFQYAPRTGELVADLAT
jgi:sarcosine oxidase